jgi:hypothetical protein
MDDYIHKQNHTVDMNYDNMTLSEIVLIANINDLEHIDSLKLSEAEIIKFNRLISNMTPQLRHLMQIYIYTHKLHHIYTLTKDEHKLLNAIVRLFNLNYKFSTYYIRHTYLPDRMGTFAPYYNKLIELIDNPKKHDYLNPFLWEYNYKLNYYILKPNILYSYLVPLNGPIFWLIRHGKTATFSLVEIVNTTGCLDCKNQLPMIPGMFKNGIPAQLEYINHNIWRSLCHPTRESA